MTLKALTLYWSAGGNTKKVADALDQTLKEEGLEGRQAAMTPELEVDYADYSLILLGAPVYQFLPPEPVMDFLKKQQGRVEVRPAAPEAPGHVGAVFCTYGGPHTGVREAVPALKYMGQFLEHAGIRVVDEWPVVGEFHAPQRQEMNLAGRLGDIRGRPNDSDLKDIREKLRGLLRRCRAELQA